MTHLMSVEAASFIQLNEDEGKQQQKNQKKKKVEEKAAGLCNRCTK